MKIGVDARKKTVAFSISIPLELYNLIDSTFPTTNRSECYTDLLKAGLRSLGIEVK